jgi:hypothetical protein
MNELDKDLYIKYGQLNIKNNIEISKINNIEVNNKVEFNKFKDFTPYCKTTYDLFKPDTNIIVPYNEYLKIKDYCLDFDTDLVTD